MANQKIILHDFDNGFSTVFMRTNDKDYKDLTNTAFEGLCRDPTKFDAHIHLSRDSCGKRIEADQWDAGVLLSWKKLDIYVHFVARQATSAVRRKKKIANDSRFGTQQVRNQSHDSASEALQPEPFRILIRPSPPPRAPPPSRTEFLMQEHAETVYKLDDDDDDYRPLGSETDSSDPQYRSLNPSGPGTQGSEGGVYGYRSSYMEQHEDHGYNIQPSEPLQDMEDQEEVFNFTKAMKNAARAREQGYREELGFRNDPDAEPVPVKRHPPMKLLLREPKPVPKKDRLEYERSGTLYYDPFLGKMEVSQKTAPRRHYLPEPYPINDDEEEEEDEEEDDADCTRKTRKRRRALDSASEEEGDEESQDSGEEGSGEEEGSQDHESDMDRSDSDEEDEGHGADVENTRERYEEDDPDSNPNNDIDQHHSSSHSRSRHQRSPTADLILEAGMHRDQFTSPRKTKEKVERSYEESDQDSNDWDDNDWREESEVKRRVWRNGIWVTR
ncbi:hypothetical protein BDV96DRAFT_225842 [Lophiotrema nucula]|uniref:Uncharacterized protein n=1 Tax=Lophiotrema nucula TaxID=690887 RepID=A0A6A5YS55_9PLEO|nr:hypothetical protein BDV96DRAFT_225842 [Lophiotrema nucula]